MGLGGSKEVALTDAMLDDYNTLTYLSKPQIIKLANIFGEMLEADNELFNTQNLEEKCVPFRRIEEEFPQIKYNPFKERLRYVFSTFREGFLFDDLLDLFSVMSANCPEEIKAAWAFKIYEFDKNNGIGKEDIYKIIGQLTNGATPPEAMEKIANVLIKEMALEPSKRIEQMGFVHGVGKMSEFCKALTFDV